MQPDPAEPAPGHFVEFYELDETLIAHLAEFARRGLATREPVVVIAGPRHREQLAGAGPDIAAAIRSARIQTLDARATLDTLMVSGSPSEACFAREIGERLRALGRGPRRVWAFGEMVDLLWRDGNARAALELEELWNGLCRAQEITLMCAYDKANFIREAPAGESIAHVCRVHAHVVPPQRATPVPCAAH